MKSKNFTPYFFLLPAILLLPLKNLLAQNIALGKNVAATSVENPSFPASNVNDSLGTGTQIDALTGLCTAGTCTRWASASNDNESITIDLAAPYELTGVTIYWETAKASSFSIDVSDDSTTWVTVETVTGDPDFVSTVNLTGHTARYVRMQGISRATAFGYSIWEFEITGTIVTPLGPNLALSGTATASSEEFPAVGALMARDGEGGTGTANYAGGCTSGTCTFWSSNSSAGDPQWIYVDLGSPKALYQLKLYWLAFAEAQDFTIDVSDDASTWTTVHDITNNTAHTNTFDMTGTTARYVRMNGLSRNNLSQPYQIYEMEIYGFVATPISLFDFNAGINGKDVEVKWTATLDYASEFVIERSGDGTHFSAIGKISEEEGSNGVKKQYTYTDGHPLPGKNYYRLKYTETGSASKYSRITSVNFAATGVVVVYPNPVQKGKPVYVDLNKAVTGNIEIRVINTLGTTVFTQKLHSNGYSVFEIPGNLKISSGNYMVQVVTNSGERISRMIQIQ